MKKALAIFGDIWHAPAIFHEQISKNLEKHGYAVDRIIDYNVPFDNLSDYDLIVLGRYGLNDNDFYTKPQGSPVSYWLTPSQEDLIETFVTNGGKLMLFHDGFTIYKKENAISRLAKSFFLGHPIIGKISVKPVSFYDDLNLNIQPYEIYDEEFDVEMDEEQTNVFLESYSDENGRHPQAWWHRYEKGVVIVFIPGHDSTVLRHPAVKQGIDNIIKWLKEYA